MEPCESEPELLDQAVQLFEGQIAEHIEAFHLPAMLTKLPEVETDACTRHDLKQDSHPVCLDRDTVDSESVLGHGYSPRLVSYLS